MVMCNLSCMCVDPSVTCTETIRFVFILSGLLWDHVPFDVESHVDSPSEASQSFGTQM
jgi:hypothetical protein